MRLFGEPIDTVREVNQTMDAFSYALQRLFAQTNTVGTADTPLKIQAAFETLADFVEKLPRENGHKVTYAVEANIMRLRGKNFLL